MMTKKNKDTIQSPGAKILTLMSLLLFFCLAACTNFGEDLKVDDEESSALRSNQQNSSSGIYLSLTDSNGNLLGLQGSSRVAAPQVTSDWKYYGGLAPEGSQPSSFKELSHDSGEYFYFSLTSAEVKSQGNKDFYIYVYPSSTESPSLSTSSLHLKLTLYFDGSSLSYTTSGSLSVSTSESAYGSISLTMNMVSSIQYAIVSLTDADGNDKTSLISNLDENKGLTVSGGVLTLASDENNYTVPTGSYTLLLKLYDGSGSEKKLIYSYSDAISVWQNCKSSKWYTAEGMTDSVSVSQEKIYSTYYVKGEGGTFYTGDLASIEASDSGAGGITSPLATVQEAVNRVLTTNDANGTLNYIIAIDGSDTSVKTSQLSISESSKKLNLTIKSLTSTMAVLDGHDGENLGRSSEAMVSIVGSGSDNTKIKFENIKFTGHNNTYSYGGALCLENLTATLSNCVISDNKIYYSGGGIYIKSGTVLYLTDGCAIEKNESTGGSGGGIYNNGTLYIGKKVVIGDKSATDCAKPDSENESGKYSNSARYNGGGIYNGRCEAYIGYEYNTSTKEKSVITNEEDWPYISYNIITIAVRNDYGGGAISIGQGGTVNIAAAKIQCNYSLVQGGALYIVGKANISGGIICNNKSDYYRDDADGYGGGGGIFIYENSETPTVSSCDFTGGKIYGNFSKDGKSNGAYILSDLNRDYYHSILYIGGSAYFPSDQTIYLDTQSQLSLASDLTLPEEAGGIAATIVPRNYSYTNQMILGANRNDNNFKIAVAPDSENKIYYINNTGIMYEGMLWAFDNLSNTISSIPDNTTTILALSGTFDADKWADFKSSLTSVYSSRGILLKLDFSAVSVLTTIASSYFNSAKWLKGVTFRYGLEEIDSSAFDQCEALTSITFPYTVKSIGKNAFQGCSSLTSVDFPSGSSWYVTTDSSATSGTEEDVTNSATNASNLTNEYVDYYWKRKS